MVPAMQLTQFSDYSLRTLIYLGLRPDELVTIEEIAGAYGISESHLTKVVHKLGKLSMIDTVRGRRGGMRLNCAPVAHQYRRHRPPDGGQPHHRRMFRCRAQHLPDRAGLQPERHPRTRRWKPS